MNKFRDRLMRFMQGRYGVDELYQFLTFLLVILMVLLFVTRNPIVNFLELFVFFYALFRVFSRNYAARRRENEIYLNATKGIRSKISLLYKRIRDRKTYRYRTCPNCHQTLRLPIRKGTNNVRCPKCGKVFETRI
ncbi:MAG: hypothetical protein IJJ19_08850 [Erysipelotrichaceae bacterium]|nr:hypothetical protein [Erysipelotrichaceae bacterium]